MIRHLTAYCGGFLGYFFLVLVALFFILLPDRNLNTREFVRLGSYALLPSLFSYTLIISIAQRLQRLPRWAVVPLALGAYLIKIPLGLAIVSLFSGQGWPTWGIFFECSGGLYLFLWPLLIPDLILASGTQIRPPTPSKEPIGSQTKGT